MQMSVVSDVLQMPTMYKQTCSSFADYGEIIKKQSDSAGLEIQTLITGLVKRAKTTHKMSHGTILTVQLYQVIAMTPIFFCPPNYHTSLFVGHSQLCVVFKHQLIQLVSKTYLFRSFIGTINSSRKTQITSCTPIVGCSADVAAQLPILKRNKKVTIDK